MHTHPNVKPHPMSTEPLNSPISPLESHLGFWLRYVSNHVSHAFRDALLAQGVSVSEWVVLRALYDLPAASASAIVEATGMSKGAVSKIMLKLIEKNWVERAICTDDKRQHSLRLTRHGRLCVRRMAAIADENDAHFFEHLDAKERVYLMQMMQSIVRHHGWRDIPIE